MRSTRSCGYSIVSCVAVLLASGCQTSSDPAANTPLARGDPVITPQDCDSFSLVDVIDLLVSVLGGSVEQTGPSCQTYTREISAGVTLDDANMPDAEWNELGGPGEIMADTAVCLLKELHKAPVISTASASTPVGNVSIKQQIGYLDFDPVAKKFEGYQTIYICAPMIGCVDADRQIFTARVKTTSPANPSGMKAGDYPIAEAYALEVSAEESSMFFKATFPPIVVLTPYGTIEVSPKVNFSNGMHVIATPFDGKPEVYSKVFGNGRLRLDDVYGRNAPVLVTSLNTQPGGWVSQLGLGARDGTPDGMIWAPDLSATFPERYDLDLMQARSALERTPNVSFGGGAKVTYSPTDILPNYIRELPFDIDFSLSVEPRFDAQYAAQLHMLMRDAWQRAGDVGAGGPPTETQLYVGHGVQATGDFHVVVTFKLIITAQLSFFTKKIVDINETEDIPLGKSSAFAPQDEGLRYAQAAAGGAPPTPPSLDRLKPFDGTFVSSPLVADYFSDCFKTTPPKQTIPPPAKQDGDPADLTPDMFPCNICICHDGVLQDDLSSSDYGNGWDTLDPGCALLERVDQGSVPDDLRWTCGDVPKADNGCFDLCTWSPTDGFTAVAKSAVETVGFACRFVPPA